MFKVSEVISKPIYSLYEGMKIGTVKNFLYDNKRKKIKGFFVFDDDSELHDQFVLTRNIFALGEDNLLVKNKSKVEAVLIEEPMIMALNAISISGECAGRVTEFYFDEKYNVLSVETNKGVVLSSDTLVRVGKDAIIFDIGEKKVNIARMKPVNRIVFEKIPDIKVNILEENKLSTIPIISSNIDEKFLNIKKIQSEIPQGDTLVKIQKTKISLPSKIISNPKSVIGKYANKVVYGLNGEIIVKKGQVISEKIYERAKKHSKVSELVNSINL